MSTEDPAWLKTLNIDIRGYPASKGVSYLAGSEMWQHSGSLLSLEPTRVYYRIDTSGGQSGSSLSTFIKGHYLTTGVHTNGEEYKDNPSKNRNFGTRISKPVFDLLVSWLKHDAKSVAPSFIVPGMSTTEEGATSALPLDPTIDYSGRLKRKHDEAFKPVPAAGGAGASSFNVKDATEEKGPSPEAKRSRPSDDALKISQARQLVENFKALTKTEDKIKFLEATDFSDVLEVDDMMDWLGRIAVHVQSDNPLSLNLQNLNILNDEILAHLLSEGMQESFYSLRRLTLEGTNLSDGIFTHISRMRHLEYLQLSNNTGLSRFREGRLADIVSSSGGISWLSMPELVDLVLNGCDELVSIELNAPKLARLDARECRKLASLQLRAPALQSVDFTGSTTITDKVIGGIRERSELLKDIEAMNTNANLYKIYNPKKFQHTNAWLASNSNIGDYGIRQFALDLPGFTALEHLDLMNNDIGDMGIRVFAEAFRGNVTVKVLNLVGNPIGDLGIIALASVLASNNILEELYLGGNNITDLGMLEVLNSIRSNHKLKKLQYDSHKISSVIRDAIYTCLDHNQKF